MRRSGRLCLLLGWHNGFQATQPQEHARNSAGFSEKKKSFTDRETPVMRMTTEIIIFLNNIRYTRDIQKDTAAEWRIIGVE